MNASATMCAYVAAAVALAASASLPRPAQAVTGIAGREIGYASYYSRRFEGRRTASGEAYAGSRYTAAHPRLPLGTAVRVTRIDGDQSVVVHVNDRGPSRTHQRRGVVIDLSLAAARELELVRAGRARVIVEILPGAVPEPPAAAMIEVPSVQHAEDGGVDDAKR